MTECVPQKVDPVPLGRPLHCFRCNTILGKRVTTGLHVGAVILHPKQSFTCARCKWRFTNASFAFAQQELRTDGRDSVKDEKPPEQEKPKPRKRGEA